jgi:predicted translin family RNA/ssDNA-binding protein
LDFTVADVIALEDAAQRYPITHLLARRLDKRNRPDTTCLITQTGIIAKESGEAISAILAAEQSSCADETAQAIAEIDEAVEALKTARARLESPKTNKGRHD